MSGTIPRDERASAARAPRRRTALHSLIGDDKLVIVIWLFARAAILKTFLWAWIDWIAYAGSLSLLGCFSWGFATRRRLANDVCLIGRYRWKRLPRRFPRSRTAYLRMCGGFVVYALRLRSGATCEMGTTPGAMRQAGQCDCHYVARNGGMRRAGRQM